MVSFPPLPEMLSLPMPPSMRSATEDPLIMSFPPRPWMVTESPLLYATVLLSTPLMRTSIELTPLMILGSDRAMVSPAAVP
jgi:hypothetical protein